MPLRCGVNVHWNESLPLHINEMSELRSRLACHSAISCGRQLQGMTLYYNKKKIAY